jgi:hypothetical protein
MSSVLVDSNYIGAHAAITGYILLTRDAARYRTYLSEVSLIAPS